MRKLTIVFHHAGGGHRSAAEALKATLSRQEHPWDVTLLDIQELLDPLDLIRRATGLRIQDTYNLILRKGWTRFTPQLLVVLQGTIRALPFSDRETAPSLLGRASGGPGALRNPALQSRDRREPSRSDGATRNAFCDSDYRFGGLSAPLLD